MSWPTPSASTRNTIGVATSSASRASLSRPRSCSSSKPTASQRQGPVPGRTDTRVGRNFAFAASTKAPQSQPTTRQLLHEGRQTIERADLVVQTTGSNVEAHKPRLPAGTGLRVRVIVLRVGGLATEERRHATAKPRGLLAEPRLSGEVALARACCSRGALVVVGGRARSARAVGEVSVSTSDLAVFRVVALLTAVDRAHIGLVVGFRRAAPATLRSSAAASRDRPTRRPPLAARRRRLRSRHQAPRRPAANQSACWRCRDGSPDLRADDAVLAEEVDGGWIDPGFLRELVDDRRLERDLAEDERIGPPSKALEGHQGGTHQIPAGIGHPCRFV